MPSDRQHGNTPVGPLGLDVQEIVQSAYRGRWVREFDFRRGALLAFIGGEESCGHALFLDAFIICALVSPIKVQNGEPSTKLSVAMPM